MDMEDVANTQDTLDLDDYPRPSSPLLRFSKREELGTKDTVASSPNQVIELHSDSPISDHYSYDYHQDISFDNNYGPNNINLSPRNNDSNYNNRPSPDCSPTLELDRSLELYQVDDLGDVTDGGGILVYSPPVSPEFGTTRVPPRSQRQQHDLSDTSFSSPPQLPPPLDFAKLGFPGAANLTQKPMDPELTPPPPDTWPILSPGLISRRLDRMRTIGSSNGSLNDDDFVEDGRQASDDTYRWRNVSTPKRKVRSRGRDDDDCVNGQEREDDEVGDSEDIPTRVPGRPKSATKTRSIAPIKRTTAAVGRYGMDFMSRADEFAAMSLSQFEDTTTTNTGVLPPSSQAGLATPSRKKNKGKVDTRVEAMARESARLADNLRQQHKVPDYQTMNMDQLRTVAKTFGLKSMRKNVLVEQLTAIWHKLNPNPRPRPELEPEPEPELDDQDRSRHDDGGMERHVVDGTFPAGFGPSQGRRYVGKGKGRADDYGPSRWSHPYDASTIFSSDLVEDGNGSSEESDLEDESEDEEEEDEDMDLDPENEGEGSSERPTRGGFGGGGPDDSADFDDLGKENQDDREPSSPTLERRLLQFLNSRSHFRKQFLMYKVNTL